MIKHHRIYGSSNSGHRLRNILQFEKERIEAWRMVECYQPSPGLLTENEWMSKIKSCYLCININNVYNNVSIYHMCNLKNNHINKH